jgi:hypothetical protein
MGRELRFLKAADFTSATPKASVETAFASFTVPKNYVYQLATEYPSVLRVAIVEELTSSTAKVVTTAAAKIAPPCSRWQTAGSLGSSDRLDIGNATHPGLVASAYVAATGVFDQITAISYSDSTVTVATNASTAYYVHYLPVGMTILVKAISPATADEEVTQLLKAVTTDLLAAMDNVGTDQGQHSLLTFDQDAWLPGQFKLELRVNSSIGDKIDLNYASGTYGAALTYIEFPVWVWPIEEFAEAYGFKDRYDLMRHKLMQMARVV